MSFSDYIVYVDESGDHGLKNIDPQYPIFVLAFCIFKKTDYVSTVVPALQSFKFRHWGHDAVVLHEHDLRKSMRGDYSILADSSTRTSLMEDISSIISEMPFHVISSIILKNELNKLDNPENPYELSMLFCLTRLKVFLQQQQINSNSRTHIIAESRGPKEDNSLELEFRRFCDYLSDPTMQWLTNSSSQQNNLDSISFDLRFVDKRANCSGLQIADLIARPIGLSVLQPEKTNRAFEIIKPKLYSNNSSSIGSELKIYPT